MFLEDIDPMLSIYKDSAGLEMLYSKVDNEIQKNPSYNVTNMYMVDNGDTLNIEAPNGVYKDAKTKSNDEKSEPDRDYYSDIIGLAALAITIMEPLLSKGLIMPRPAGGIILAAGATGIKLDLSDELNELNSTVAVGTALGRLLLPETVTGALATEAVPLLRGPIGALISAFIYGVYKNVTYTMEHEEEIIQRYTKPKLNLTPEEYNKRFGNVSWDKLDEYGKKDIEYKTQQYNYFYPGGMYDGASIDLKDLGFSMELAKAKDLQTIITQNSNFEMGRNVNSQPMVAISGTKDEKEPFDWSAFGTGLIDKLTFAHVTYASEKTPENANQYAKNQPNNSYENKTSTNTSISEDLTNSTFSENKYGPQQIEYTITVPVEINTTVNEAEKFDVKQLLRTIGPEVENEIRGFISTQGLRVALDR